MWNSLFWPCMDRGQGRKHCVDGSVDDVGFVAYVLNHLQQLLPSVALKQQAVLSGYSNGGMLAQVRRFG